jgi:tRNA (mo5U34)-methyltransferase
VLDIGAWDGLHSFMAERAGASRVVALDHYAWGVDLHARQQYWEECQSRGVFPDQERDETDFFRPELPGRRPFDLAREALGSKVEPVVADFMTADLAALGTFDVVLYLGVLYHMREPLTALTRLRKVTGEVAVIDTVGLSVPGHRGIELLRFYPGNELNNDFGNWYAVSEAALHGLCRAAGFSGAKTVLGETTLARWMPRLLHDIGGTVRRMALPARRYRLIVHAYP